MCRYLVFFCSVWGFKGGRLSSIELTEADTAFLAAAYALTMSGDYESVSCARDAVTEWVAYRILGLAPLAYLDDWNPVLATLFVEIPGAAEAAREATESEGADDED